MGVESRLLVFSSELSGDCESHSSGWLGLFSATAVNPFWFWRFAARLSCVCLLQDQIAVLVLISVLSVSNDTKDDQKEKTH